MRRQRIAVIGAGISGIVAAHYLARRHEVVLFEARDRLGGHTNTIEIGSWFPQDEGTPIDTGFIVYNDRTYPNFIRFLDELGIRGAPTDMSFSLSDPDSGFAYAGTGLAGLFAKPANAWNPGFWSFLASVLRFNRRAARDLRSDNVGDGTLKAYLERIGSGKRLERDYLSPMIQAIWSAPGSDSLAIPASLFLRFVDNHGLLSRPGSIQWRYIKGGSRTYLDAFQSRFPGEVRLKEPVRAVSRTPEGPVIHHQDGEERFDAVVIAAHADQALAMLPDADELERSALGPWHYSANTTVLHCDPSHMPPFKRAWACWNVLRFADDETTRRVRVTYWMNRLQRLNATRNWMVSLNADWEFAPDTTAYRTVYEHPVFSMETLQAQKLLPSISGRNGTYFCGSYHGYGFHEDGARSAVDLVHKHFGIEP
ncbi:MAG: FAD-dependent oxidoreductase [Desulfohalobiaceae bacterium]